MDKILSGCSNTKWQLGREAPNRGVSNDYPIGRDTATGVGRKSQMAWSEILLKSKRQTLTCNDEGEEIV